MTMKWYSVKEYSPIIETEYLVFTENRYIYIARYENVPSPGVWIGRNEEDIHRVTHFCVIEPVSINKSDYQNNQT